MQRFSPKQYSSYPNGTGTVYCTGLDRAIYRNIQGMFELHITSAARVHATCYTGPDDSFLPTCTGNIHTAATPKFQATYCTDPMDSVRLGGVRTVNGVFPRNGNDGICILLYRYLMRYIQHMCVWPLHCTADSLTILLVSPRHLNFLKVLLHNLPKRYLPR